MNKVSRTGHAFREHSDYNKLTSSSSNSKEFNTLLRIHKNVCSLSLA